MKYAGILAVLLMIGATQSAAATEEYQCDYKNDPDSGLVVFSAAMPIPEQWHTGMPMSFSYIYNRADGSFLTDHTLELQPFHFLHENPSDIPGGYGRIFTLKLAAGDYEFKYWTYKPYGHSATLRLLQIKPLKFSVEPQRATYLGSFVPQLASGKNIVGMTEYRPRLTVRDEHSRDASIFLTKCPGFDVTQLDIKVMDPAPWAAHQESP